MGVAAFVGQQRLVGAGLDYTSIVEYGDRRVGKHQSGKGNPLGLRTGQLMAVLPNDRGRPVR